MARFLSCKKQTIHIVMMMKKINIILLFLLSAVITGCEVIGDIFSAGFYAGIFVVVFVIALIIFIAVKVRRK